MDKKGIGQVVGLYIKDKKESKVKLIEEGFFEEDKGLVGDAHFNGGNRQVSIFTAYGRKALLLSYRDGLCTKKFYENIRVKDLNLEKLEIGSIIQVGDSLHEVTEIGKRCFPNCKIVEKGDTCPLASQAIFTRIIRGGSVSIGDRVELKG